MTQRHPHRDEHMTHYEWSGAIAAIPLTPPVGTRRDHPWHASTGILALLATLLILNGCERQDSPAGRAGAQIDETVQGMGTPDVEPDPAEAAGPAPDAMRESLGDRAGPAGEPPRTP